MQIKSLSPALGAEITGINLARKLSDAERFELRAAWDRYHLLAFPDQVLSDEEHVAACEVIGPVQIEATGQKHGYVTNRGETGFVTEERFEWHMDYCFTPYPLQGISLHAQVLPAGGTRTFFANNARGFATLPAALKRRVRTLKIRNMGDFVRGDQTAVAYKQSDLCPDNPHVVEALVRKHPHKAVELLYCCHMMTDHIVDLPADESRALLEQLFAHLYAPDNVLALEWQPRQLVIWDNIAVQHSRPDVALADGERTLRRVCVAEHDVVAFLAPYWEKTQWARTAFYERDQSAG